MSQIHVAESETKVHNQIYYRLYDRDLLELEIGSNIRLQMKFIHVQNSLLSRLIRKCIDIQVMSEVSPSENICSIENNLFYSPQISVLRIRTVFCVQYSLRNNFQAAFVSEHRIITG